VSSVDDTFLCISLNVVYNTNIEIELWMKKVMKTSREYQQQQRNNDNRDRLRLEDGVMDHEPKEHLHQNYRHWAWLAKPK